MTETDTRGGALGGKLGSSAARDTTFHGNDPGKVAEQTICHDSPTRCQARTRLYRKGVLAEQGFPIEQISDHLSEPDTTVWLDLRDRILTPDSLYLAIASAAPDFDADSLNGMAIRLVFKDRAAALPEHVADRFDQVKDNWGFLVEEHTASKRESLFRRLNGDITDLFRVDPEVAVAHQRLSRQLQENAAIDGHRH